VATLSCQSTWYSGRVQNYAKKDYVVISAIGTSVQMFEHHLQEIRVASGKAGVQPSPAYDAAGNILRDEHGHIIRARDKAGNVIFKPKYIQAYSLVQSFGHSELEPDDPASWERANDLGRAVAATLFDGHPVLIATEVNGRSGCVHNHIIVGAIHAESGKSLDSNRVTHSRLAIAHDDILATNGFTQRADMRAITQDAKQRISDARAEVLAQLSADVTDSERRRRLIAAENSIRLRGTLTSTPTQQREDKRLREFDRYTLNEQTRAIATELGIDAPAERFSEIELESRITKALSDPRSKSWDDLTAVARIHGVTITRRGQDVSYGMMLIGADGTLAEPARAHTRRGKSLGDGYRFTDIDAAIDRNADLQRAAVHQDTILTPAQQMQRWRDSGDFDAEFERRFTEVEAEAEVASDSVDATAEADTRQSEPEPFRPRTFRSTLAAAPPSAPPTFRSRVHDISATTEHMRARLLALAELEERWHGTLPITHPERVLFEEQAAKVGIGPTVLSRVGTSLDPDLHALLTARAEHAEEREQARRRTQELSEQMPLLQKKASDDQFNQRGHITALSAAKQTLRFESAHLVRLTDDHKAGIYDSRQKERIAHLKNKTAAQLAELDRRTLTPELEGP
jgi:hypothetical protein